MKQKSNLTEVSWLFVNLPGFWLIFKSLELALLKSKSPEWFGLYSSSKLIAILTLLSISSIWIIFVAPKLRIYCSQKKLLSKFKYFNPFWTFILVIITARVLLLFEPVFIGEDVAPQVLSARQWLEGSTNAPNILASPNYLDLSSDNHQWIPRPPGASWIGLPWMIIGVPIGTAIKISLFCFSMFAGIGWIMLGRRFEIPSNWLITFSIFLAFALVLKSLSFSTGSAFTYSTFPWFILGALGLARSWESRTINYRGFLLVCFFFGALGLHALFKLSSLLTLSTIALIPFLLHLSAKKKITFKIIIFGIFALAAFFSPYLLLSTLTQSLTGISSNELYVVQNYNLQHELWGRFFEETTRGKMLALSILSAPGYASPAQGIFNGFRDLLLHSEIYQSFLISKEINPRIMGCCLLAAPLSLIIGQTFWKTRKILSNEEIITLSSIIFMPAFTFALISNLHSWNYLIYHSYTAEYSIIYFLFPMILFKRLSLTESKGFNILVTFSLLIALPLCSVINSISSKSFSAITSIEPSIYEKNSELGASIYSSSLEEVTADSTSNNDVVIFFCAGNRGDSRLRTKFRSISLNFSEGNLGIIDSFDTSETVTAYCLVDPRLSTNKIFMRSMFKKFNTKFSRQKINTHVWKFEFQKLPLKV